MRSYTEHFVSQKDSVRDVLIKLDKLAIDAIVFLVNDSNKLLGSLTDGDFRRGFISGLNFDDDINKFVQSNPRFIRLGETNIDKIREYRNKNFKILPVLDKDDRIVNIVNFRLQKSYLPLDAVIMAGGKGERLKPLTDNVPKPLLKVGERTILEHNTNNLRSYGIQNYWLTVRHFSNQIKAHIDSCNYGNINIKFIEEDHPLGTAGSLSIIDDFKHNHIILLNADLLNDVDFEKLYLTFLKEEADMIVTCIPYKVHIPYAVIETTNNRVTGFKEKPTYSHYSNAGIYIIKREVIKYIPKNTRFNATDLMSELINANKKVVTYNHSGYWLDIGKPLDFEKAQKDIHLLS